MSTPKIPQDNKPAKIDWSDKEQKRAYMLQWHAQNRERIKKARRRYDSEHPDYKKASDARYFARVKSDAKKLAERNQKWNERRRRRGEEFRAGRAKYARERRAHNPQIRKKEAAAAKAAYHSKPAEERKMLRLARAQYYKQWRAEHADELNESNKEYRKKNKARILEAWQVHYEKYKQAYINRANKRRALLVGTYTDADIAQLYENQNGVCNGCRKPLNAKFERDHIMPLALDPTGDRLDNLQLLCRPCNRSKRAMHPEQWAARLGKVPA